MYNVAIVGATGNVGRKFLEILEERNFPVKELYLFASKRSAGKTLKFKGEDVLVEELCEANIENKKIDFALFSAGGSVSLEFAPIFAKHGAVVIDNSSAWRMDKEVPLVVPEVNPEDVKWHKGIIANPNCSTIQAMVALKPLYDKYGIKRIVYSTYQAVSGAGIQGILDLQEGTTKKFPYPILGNVIPHIDVFLDNGYTKEEIKMIEETKKIVHDDVENLKYPTPLELSGKDEVFVGRIRRDFSLDNGLNLWVVADNIRKGAALNAIQIAEILINEK